VGDVVLDVIETFPKHDLDSDEGIQAAIEEIEAKFAQILAFEVNNIPSDRAF
jgi:hypothetical protein